MATPQRLPDFFHSLGLRLQEARSLTDDMFRYLPPNSFYERPVEERHRLIFYLGHLEAFDWNLMSGPLGLSACHPAFDKLFAFGIDPVGGGLPTDIPGDWPSIAQVEEYNSNVRRRLDEALQRAQASQLNDELLASGLLLNVAIEHRLMHAETLAYLLHSLPLDKKVSVPHIACDPSPSPAPLMVNIPSGIATLGCAHSVRSAFGWDN
ncbi:MAG: DinB family protein, partial [Candidatus Acidiferrales bacterium]